MDPLTNQIRDMYTKFPFPSKDREANELPAYLPAFARALFAKKKMRHMADIAELVAKLLGGRKPPHRVLDAGCGTGEILSHIAARLPDAEMHALDLTPASLEKAKALIAREGRRNVAFHEHDLMEPLPFEPGSFDVVVSVGVLHCLTDTVTGFRNIARCLSPGGVLLCWFYGALGRWDLRLKQEVVSLLAKDETDFEDKIRIVESLDLYPRRRETPLKDLFYQMLGFDLETTRRVWIVDQLGHLKEKVYLAADIETELEAAGMSLVEFHGMPNRASDLIADPELRTRAEALSRAEQYRLIELMVRPAGYLFTARAKSS